MKAQNYITVTLFAILLVSGSVLAHDASLHTSSDEKPNCAAMHDMDNSKMNMDDPVMQAMMKQCMESHTENVDSSTMIKSECTEEHVKMGHCKMDEASGISDQAAPSASENHHGN